MAVQRLLDLKWDVYGGLSVLLLQTGEQANHPPWSRETSGVYSAVAKEEAWKAITLSESFCCGSILSSTCREL